ncbi:PAS domain-containing protein [Geobacillus sp. YF-1]|uniref:PAS domain-containing protein n=1 Tax=Geobacillus sp. YF-1 TaxID=3457480 RepID=UPI00404540D0
MKVNVQAIDQQDAGQLNQGIVITSSQCLILAVSERVAARLEFSKDELIGRPVASLFSAGWSAARFDDIIRRVRQEGCWQGEARHMTKSGRICTTRVRQSLGKQNASHPLIPKGREALGHTLGVYLGARMNA